MARKRMITLDIVGTDDFKDMSTSAQALYFHLVCNADDEGFSKSAKSIMRSIGAEEKDLEELVNKHFIIRFDSGVICIKHWLLHNKIQPSRIVPTRYTEERALLAIKDNESYTLADKMPTKCRQSADKMSQSIDIDKIRLDKNNIVPTIEDIQTYIQDNNLNMDAVEFFNYYNNNNWTTKNNEPVKNWKNLCSAWAKREYPKKKVININHRPKESDEFYDSLISK